MKAFAFAAITAGALASAALASSGSALAAPTGPSEVDETVKTLQASGYHVVVNRTGAAPLSECSVDQVREGQTHLTTDSGSDLEKRVVSETVYVDVSC